MAYGSRPGTPCSLLSRPGLISLCLDSSLAFVSPPETKKWPGRAEVMSAPRKWSKQRVTNVAVFWRQTRLLGLDLSHCFAGGSEWRQGSAERPVWKIKEYKCLCLPTKREQRWRVLHHHLTRLVYDIMISFARHLAASFSHVSFDKTFDEDLRRSSLAAGRLSSILTTTLYHPSCIN